MRATRWHESGILVGFLAALLAGCSMGKDREVAEAEIAHFRSQVATQQYSEIYTESGDEFKTASEQETTAFFTSMRTKLGPFKSTSQSGWKVNSQFSGSTVTLSYQTSFEFGTAIETFVFRVVDGKATLAGYHIGSIEVSRPQADVKA